MCVWYIGRYICTYIYTQTGLPPCIARPLPLHPYIHLEELIGCLLEGGV